MEGRPPEDWRREPLLGQEHRPYLDNMRNLLGNPAHPSTPLPTCTSRRFVPRAQRVTLLWLEHCLREQALLYPASRQYVAYRPIPMRLPFPELVGTK